MWTAEDRAKVIAYDEWKAGECPQCHTRSEWWDPDQGGHRFAFIADTHRCPGCEIKEQEREQIPKEAKGIHVFLTPNPEVFGGPPPDDDEAE